MKWKSKDVRKVVWAVLRGKYPSTEGGLIRSTSKGGAHEETQRPLR